MQKNLTVNQHEIISPTLTPDDDKLNFQIIVPVFNEEKVLERVLVHAKELDYIKCMIFVNDASTDSSAVILDRWAAEENLNVIHLSKNAKKEGAIREVM